MIVCLYHKANLIKSSAIKTAAQEKAATVSKPRSKYARITAVTNPAVADTTDPVEVKIAGTVITERTAYGI